MASKFPYLHVLTHPLIQEKLTILRDKKTHKKEFRHLVSEISAFMFYEISRSLKVQPFVVTTPMKQKMKGVKLERALTLVPILRAGLGMLEGIHRMVPTASIGHVGLYRDEETLQPVEYFFKFPKNLADSDAIVLDPMLATGGTLIATIDLLKSKGCRKIMGLFLVASPEGLKAVTECHPEVDIFTAAIDERLNEKGYIIPGLGDAGDKIFGTH